MPRRSLAAAAAVEPIPETVPVPEPVPEPVPGPAKKGRKMKELIPLPEGLKVADMTPEQKICHQRNLAILRSRRCAAKKKTATATAAAAAEVAAEEPVLIPNNLMSILNDPRVAAAISELIGALKVTCTDSATQTDPQEEPVLEPEPEPTTPHKLRGRKRKAAS